MDSEAKPDATLSDDCTDGGVAKTEATPIEEVDSDRLKDTKESLEEKMEVDEVEASEKKEKLELEGEESEMEVDTKEEESEMEVDTKKEKSGSAVEEDSEAPAAVAGPSDPVSLASRQPREVDGRIGELEKSYGVLMMEKALGLLTAILPQDMTVSIIVQFWSHDHHMIVT